MEDLADFLGRYPPFDALDRNGLDKAAAAAGVRRHGSGELVLDAFHDRDDAVYVVLTGQVDLWFDPDGRVEPDEVCGVGDVFGFSAMLTERSVGPRAVAAVDSSVIRLPAAVATLAFTSRRGVGFLAGRVLAPRPRSGPPTYGQVDELVRQPPLVVRADTPISDVARLMGREHRSGVVVELPRGRHALVTDASLRQRVVVDGVPPAAPASMALDPHTPSLLTGDSASEALVAMLDGGADVALLTDGTDRPLGVVSMRDLATSPSTADVRLYDHLRHASDPAALSDVARRIPGLLDDLLGRGLASGKVIAVYSTMLDTVIRRAVTLVVADRPALSVDEFTWLSLGSNGRREAVLSSDVDSAVVFVREPDPVTADAYRAAFAQVDEVLAAAGLSADGHGVSAQHPAFSRSRTQWRAAAQGWVASPEKDQGALMLSLLVDGRPIHGDPGLREVSAVLRDVRTHPGVLRLLLTDSLARRPKRRSAIDLLRRRPERFDIKRHALLPVVNLARWAAFCVGSAALPTQDRLRSAAGSPMLPEQMASRLVEVFEVLQRLRLRYQILQYEAGQAPSDGLIVRDMSPIDRSVIGQAVSEIAHAQRRMANVSSFVDADEWARIGTL